MPISRTFCGHISLDRYQSLIGDSFGCQTSSCLKPISICANMMEYSLDGNGSLGQGGCIVIAHNYGGIANFTTQELQNRVNGFRRNYMDDWNNWLEVGGPPHQRTVMFGAILRRWNACRPNSMRRTREEQLHYEPYLDDLLNKASPFLLALQGFDIRLPASFTRQACDSLLQLWSIFQCLSYRGRARGGAAGVVGISKAVLLLTEGRVGPAFDSRVRANLGIKRIENAYQWICALQFVSRDIQQFEASNHITIQQAAPNRHVGLNSGRIYDMALGPAEN